MTRGGGPVRARVTVLSLCAGIGGLDLAAKEAFGGVTVGYVEIDPYCQAVLRARMRDGWLDSAPIWPDLRTFDGLAWRGAVDCIVAGFPCQPFSVAGQRKREADERNLWPEVYRVLCEVRPAFAFMENVPGLIHAPYWGTILADLAESGYGVRWDCVPASAAGAPHRRDRLYFIVADTERLRCATELGGESGSRPGEPARHEPASCGGPMADPDDAGRREQRRSESVSEAQHPAQCGCEDVAHAGGFQSIPGRDVDQERRWQDEAEQAWLGGSDVAHPNGNDGNRWSGDVQVGRSREPGEAAPVHLPGRDEWSVEPPVGRVAHGVSNRMDQLTALGNAVVPAQAVLAWRLLTTRLAPAASGPGA